MHRFGDFLVLVACIAMSAGLVAWFTLFPAIGFLWTVGWLK